MDCTHLEHKANCTSVYLSVGCVQGKITVKQAVLSDLASGGKSLWKYRYSYMRWLCLMCCNTPLLLSPSVRPCPFVYLYDKVPDLDLCIDAR